MTLVHVYFLRGGVFRCQLSRLSKTSLPDYVLVGIIDAARDRVKVTRKMDRESTGDSWGLGILKVGGACWMSIPRPNKC